LTLIKLTQSDTHGLICISFFLEELIWIT